MKKRDSKGKFVYNGGKLGEKRDKKCPICGNNIMRKSTTCRGCWQRGNSEEKFESRNGYSARHQWINRNFGRPQKCEHCGTTEAGYYEWATKRGDYGRVREDWLRLCKVCHVNYDKKRVYEKYNIEI